MLIIFAWVIVNSTVIFIPAGQVGVVTKAFAILGEKGVVNEDFEPGWHWDVGPLHTWTLFDSTIQTLEMTRQEGYGDRKGRDDVEVQSADGYAVSVDVTVKYRIKSGDAYKLYKQTGGKEKYKTIVRTQSKKACLAQFGEMTTEDFYNPEKRRVKAKDIKVVLQKILGQNFVEVVDVLIKSVKFDEQYERKIQLKKLSDQEVQLNISMAAAEEMSGKTQVIKAETAKMLKIIKQEQEAKITTMEAKTNREIAKIKAEFDRYVTKKRADADLIAAEKRAKGSLLIKEAEAEGERLRNEAMRGVGGSTIVALEAAKNIQLDDMIISTLDVDPVDLEEMAKKLGAKKEIKK